jgi:hypothetical protein
MTVSEPLVVAKDLLVEYPGRPGKKGFRAVNGVSFEIPVPNPAEQADRRGELRRLRAEG